MIDILMAVYDGGEFLGAQIDSIISQTEKDWRLHICDDGSADGSFERACEYEKRFSDKIRVTRNEVPTGSAKGNFMGMLKNSTAEYVMFSDQDDVWKPEKIRLTLEKMRDMEREFPGSPLLVHTDMSVVGRDLNVTASSFIRFQGLNPECKSLNRLLCQNNITGCTMMMNRALVDIVKDAPAEEMLMHDWWAGLAAAAFGHIGFVDIPLNLYRQHGGNQLGAVNNRSVRGAVRVMKRSEETKKRLSVTYEQAAKFYEYYKDILNADSRGILEKYIAIPKMGKAARICGLIKYDFLKQNFMAAAGQLVFC
ncbi:MAG: glycosyltransferase family 2 protein [Oscillospiraceae bacterium]|nr:glycosyltransferase family 2 protein [Oscillospiraceae bacterium]